MILVQWLLIYVAAFLLVFMFQVPVIMALRDRQRAQALKTALARRLIADSCVTGLFMAAAALTAMAGVVTQDSTLWLRGVLAQMSSISFLALYMIVSVLLFTRKLVKTLESLLLATPPENPLAVLLRGHLRRVKLFTVVFPSLALTIFLLVAVPFVTFFAVGGYFPYFSVLWAVTCCGFPQFGFMIAIVFTKGRSVLGMEESQVRQKKYVGGAELGLNSYEEHVARRMKNADNEALTFQAGSVMSMPDTSRGGSSFVGGGSRVAAVMSEEGQTSQLHEEDIASSQAAGTSVAAD